MTNRPEMTELPELVILLISKHLSYVDLKNLRVTCKRLKEIIDQRTSTSLYLFIGTRPFERQLFYTGELVSHANTLHVRRLGVLRSIKFKSQFGGLLKLTIYYQFKFGSYFRNFKVMNLSELSCFEELTHLELHGVVIECGRLNLKKLKIIHFFDTTRDISDFELNCPRLKVLGLGHETEPRRTPRLTQETSHSISHLHIASRTRETYVPHLCGQLKNLTTICFGRSDELTKFLMGLTGLMKRKVSLPPLLKKIKLEKETHFVERGVLFRDLSNFKSRSETRHIEVQINSTLMNGDELAEMHKLLDQIDPNEEFFSNSNESIVLLSLQGSLLRHFKENPIFHSLLPAIRNLRLRSDEDVKLSRPLIGRLRSLKHLTIGNKIELDEPFFESMLKACRRVFDLRITSACLKQQQLHQISNQLPNVQNLSFGGDFLLGNYNLDFVVKFKRLTSVGFYFNIQKETMHFLLKNCKHLPNFHLELFGEQNIWIFGRRIEIIRGSQSTGSYLPSSNKKTKFDSINDLVEHYYRNDLFNVPWQD